MTRFFLLLTFIATTTFAAEPQMAPKESGLKSIFNGKDLTGWDGDSKLWEVKDGVIRGETTKEKKAKGNTFLIWKDGKLKDFELRLSFKCSTQNNSGIQYRSVPFAGKGENKWRVKGYQHEIRNSNKLPNVSGFIYDEGGMTKRGRTCMVGEKATWKEGEGKKVIAELITAAEYAKLFKVDEWNEVIIICKGNHIQHYMNGRLVLDFEDHHPKAPKEGVLALQLHAGAPMWAEYKDIRIKNL